MLQIFQLILLFAQAWKYFELKSSPKSNNLPQSAWKLILLRLLLRQP